MQILGDYFHTLATGILPDGSMSSLGAIPAQDLEDNWMRPVLPASVPRAGTTRCTRKPGDYMAVRIGAQGNRRGLVVTQSDFNALKGRVFNLRSSTGASPPRPIAESTFNNLLAGSAHSQTARNTMFNSLRMIIGVFNYLHHPDLLPIIQGTIGEMTNAADEIASHVYPLRGVGTIWRQFVVSWYREAARRARTFVEDRIEQIRLHYEELERQGRLPNDSDEVDLLLGELISLLDDIRSPF